MNILVTGGNGYKGCVLIPKLLEQGHKVISIDNDWFGNYLKPHKNLIIRKKDIREIGYDDLNNIEVISVRPNQFIIDKPESTNDSPKFTGKISSLSEMGSFIEVVLSTGNLDLLIHFPFDSKVNKDEEITVSISNFDRI